MKRLKELRQQKGVSQQAVASSLGVTRQAYCNYENGNREPDTEALLNLAQYFDVTVDFLLGRDDEKPAPQEEDGPTDEMEQELIAYLPQLTFEQKRLLRAQLQAWIQAR